MFDWVLNMPLVVFNFSWTKRFAIALMAKSSTVIDLTAKMVLVHEECKTLFT